MQDEHDFFCKGVPNCGKKILTVYSRLPILTLVMLSTRTFFYFAFTYRYFFNKESGPAKFENDVLTT